MNRCLAAASVFAAVCLSSVASADVPPPPLPVTAHQPAAYVDPAAHASSLVDVGAGVKLSVLDFGGKGDAILFVPGLNDTAHIYDDLAPRFVSGYHVYAVSRRGCGDSTKPASGDYGTGARTQDLVALLDALKIKKANFVGHSIAGDEITALAGAHPERVIKLVYLDAAYDRSGGPFSAFANLAPQQAAVYAATPPSALATLDAYRKYWQDFALGVWNSASEANMQDRMTVAADGSVTEKCPPLVTAQFLIATATAHPDETKVKAPALCLFATFGDLVAQGAPATVAAAMTTWQKQAETNAAQQMRAKVIPYPPGTSHYLFIQYPDRCAGEIRAFLAGK